MSPDLPKPDKPSTRPVTKDVRIGRYGANFLEAFRSGWDTDRIARVYEVFEAEVYNALARARGQQTEAGPRRTRRL